MLQSSSAHETACAVPVVATLEMPRYVQIYKGDPRPRIPTHVMASSAMGLKIGDLQVFY